MSRLVLSIAAVFAVAAILLLVSTPALTGMAATFDVGQSITADGQTIGAKVVDDSAFETRFVSREIVGSELVLKFYQDGAIEQPVWIEQLEPISYTLSTEVAQPNAEVPLRVSLDGGRVPRFKLHVGSTSEVFEFGITIINVQSYPIVGGNWTVAFETVGTADLIITPVDGTAWNEDLEFLELRCGSSVLDAQFDGTSVIYPNYSCDQTGTETSLVLTPGKHTLEFRFGDDVDYAHNEAYVLCYQETANVSTACGGLATGSYAESGTLRIDGDWATLAALNDPGPFFVNYSKPSNSVNTSKWQVKTLIDTVGDLSNRSIDYTCWSQNPLQFKINASFIDSTTTIYYRCYNGSSWVNIGQYSENFIITSGYLYEEAMWWNMTVTEQNISNCTNLNQSGITYYLNQSVSSGGTCMNVTAPNVTLDCKGYNITYGTGGGNNAWGVNVTGVANAALANVTVKNCIIQKTSGGGASGYGIRLYNTSASLIQNNTIRTNGTSSNFGIYLSSSSNDNNLASNNVSTSGVADSNYGIRLDSTSNYNILTSNNISTNGIGSSNHGIYLSTNSDYNVLSANNVSTDGTNNDVGIYLATTSRFNNITSNKISTRGRTGSTNYGIWLSSSSNNTIASNNVSTNSTANGNHGIYAVTSSNNTITSNNISAYGVTIGNYGIHFQTTSVNNTVTSNRISTYGSSSNYGIYLLTNCNYNAFTSNNITTINATSHGIYIYDSSHNRFAETKVNVTSDTAYEWASGLSSYATTNNTAINLTLIRSNVTVSLTAHNGTTLKGMLSTEPNANHPNADQAGINKYVNATNTTTNSWLYLNISYADSDWQNAGIVNESTLRIWKYNTSGWNNAGFYNQYGVDNVSNVAYANITNFASTFGVFGEVPTVQNISNCTTLNQTGMTYYFNQSIWNVTGTCMNVMASNVTLDCKGNTIDGNDTTGSEYGINNTGGFDYVTIKNCNITDFNYGIYFGNGADHGNILLNNLTSNIYGVYIKTSLNNTIESNIADSNPNYGITLESSANNTIFNNTARSNGNGINFFTSSNNNISGNRANSNANGMSATSSSYNQIISNDFNSNTNGVQLSTNSDYNIISDNNASSNPNVGIRISFSSNHNLIAENNASSNGAGISIAAACINNTVSGNIANLNSLGITLDSSTNNTLSNNIANSNTQDGIVLYSSADFNTLNNNTANGNTLTGIQVQSSLNTNLTNNTANSNQQHGIYIQSGSNDTIVNNNAANSNFYYGIYISSSSHNSLILNTAQNNTWDWYSEYNSSNNTVINLTSYQNSLTFTSYDIALKGMQTGIYADPSSQKNISKYLNATNNSADSWLYLNISYLDTDWQNANITNESSLRIWKYNQTSGSWISTGFNSTGGVNVTENYVYANITTFSTFGVFGEAVDSTPPSIVITAPDAGSWQRVAFNVTFNASDETQLASCSYQIRNGSAGSWSANASVACTNATLANATVTVGAAANCTVQGTDECGVRMWAIDGLGNTNYTERNFSIDYTVPTSITTSPLNRTWQRANFNLNIVDADTGGSGLNASACYWRIVDFGVQSWPIGGTVITGKPGTWGTRTCNANVTVTVGPTGNCTTQGSLMCRVESFAIDVAGNVGS